MLNSILKALFGSKNERTIKELSLIVDKVNSFSDTFKNLSDSDLKYKTLEFKQRLKNKETLDDLLPEAFAVVRETAWRVLGERPFDVQVMGGIVLHQGKIAEMKTGEGKTLTSTMPVYLGIL
jgi:protein translocase subunit secA